jgi:hypothetical protein
MTRRKICNVYAVLVFALALSGCSSEPTEKKGREVSVPVAGERQRVHVGNGTVLSDRDTLLRGASMMILARPNYSNDPAFWESVHALGLNAVRLDVKTTQVGRTVQEQLPSLDKAVNLAADNDMYIMVKTSSKPGTYDLDELIDFWTVVAPRYKNRTHVFFELTNEPVSGRAPWGAADQWTDEVIEDLTKVYNVMRAAAPDTHIVLFSTANLYPDCESYKNVIAKMKGVDWTKASVGFHHYRGTEQFGEKGIQCLRQSYPLIMTETNYWMDDGAGRSTPATVLRLYEKLGISWFSLDGKGRLNHLRDEIIPDLRSQGYTWSLEQ